MVTEIFKLLRESLQPPPQAVQLCQHFHNMKSMKLLGREFREANSNHNCQTIDEACPELEIMESSSRIQLTDTIFEIPIPRPDTTMIGSSNQPSGPVIDITLPEQPESPPAAPKADSGKGKVTNDVESPPKLVKALLKVRLDPDTPIRVPYLIHGKMYQLTEDEIQAHLDKEEKIEQVAKEANLSKHELIKVIQEEATKAGVDPKILASAKGGQEFRKI
ncbi:hypothetical protein Tco_0088021 [Tanacetum coccineum]